MSWAANLLFGLGRLAIVLGINVSLFLVIPASHSLFGGVNDRPKDTAPQRRIVAELVKPKEKQTKNEPTRRLRSVQNASSEALRNPMKFKFTPDLSVASGGEGVAMQSRELSAEVFEEGEVDQNARTRHFPTLRYPDRARELGVVGTVVINYIVDENGRAYGFEELSSPHPSLTAAVREALEEAKFDPALKRGIPVKQSCRGSFDFHLD